MGRLARKHDIQGGMKRIFLGAVILLALGTPVSIMPAWAETPSKTCVADIQAANRSRRAPPVPVDCWRIGPLRLGMTQVQTRTFLGAPDVSSDFTLSYGSRKVPVTRQLYVYPRNLHNWLKLAPAHPGDFHPVTLKLDFSKGALVAIGVDTEARLTPPPCKPSAPGRGFVRSGLDFPYGLHGMTLGAPLSSVEARFGRFAGGNAAHDFHIYWPVPLSVDAKDIVTGFRMATGAPFESGGGEPDFALMLDPRSCFVTGYVLKPS
jgi:hypothetical protein